MSQQLSEKVTVRGDRPPYTVGELKRILSMMPDDLPLIYAHDDEGNEFQFMMNMPHITHVSGSTVSYRHLDIVTADEPKAVKVVCIN